MPAIIILLGNFSRNSLINSKKHSLYPFVTSTNKNLYLSPPPYSFAKTNGMISKNEKIFPLGGISNSIDIMTNEQGYHPIFMRDKFGFRNPCNINENIFVNNIIIGDKATVNTKPQLEIFADDVKCSHGCTIGQLDKSALFYLQTRGIPKKEAKALLTYAFANNVLESVKIKPLKTKIKKIIAGKLGVNLGFEL